MPAGSAGAPHAPTLVSSPSVVISSAVPSGTPSATTPPSSASVGLGEGERADELAGEVRARPRAARAARRRRRPPMPIEPLVLLLFLFGQRVAAERAEAEPGGAEPVRAVGVEDVSAGEGLVAGRPHAVEADGADGVRAGPAGAFRIARAHAHESAAVAGFRARVARRSVGGVHGAHQSADFFLYRCAGPPPPRATT